MFIKCFDKAGKFCILTLGRGWHATQHSFPYALLCPESVGGGGCDMHLMTRENLEELLGDGGEPRVSLFMPAVKGSESLETKQNPIRFRKLLGEAGKKLEAAGYRPAEAEKLLEPARPLLEDHKFWQYLSGGLALFLSPKIKRFYNLPLNFRELTMVADRFCVTPLLQLFAEDGRFYVLTLSQHSIQLYQCSRYSAARVDLGQVPKNIADLLELNPREKQLQFHANTEGRAGKTGRAGMFHGHAEDSNEAKSNILVYFQSVNKGVTAMLKDERAPLVTAGVDYLNHIYAEANTYRNLYVRSIPGSVTGLRPEELRDRAWELLKPLFEAEARSAVQRYDQVRGTPAAACHIKPILLAAEEGNVATLLVAADAQKWGTYDPATGELDLHKSPEPADTELVDLCVTRTLRGGGKVYVMEPSKMPGISPLAAIFRH